MVSAVDVKHHLLSLLSNVVHKLVLVIVWIAVAVEVGISPVWLGPASLEIEQIRLVVVGRPSRASNIIAIRIRLIPVIEWAHFGILLVYGLFLVHWVILGSGLIVIILLGLLELLLHRLLLDWLLLHWLLLRLPRQGGALVIVVVDFNPTSIVASS